MKWPGLTSLVRAAQHRFRRSANPAKMAVWALKVEEIIRKPPGSDEGFDPQTIAIYAGVDFSKMSTWAIVCEEVLDTSFPRLYHQRAWEELRRRGITDDEIQELRRFAWLTAGWLNFEKMLWDWTSLDDDDIYRAIKWQYSDGWISAEERDRRMAFARQYDSRAA